MFCIFSVWAKLLEVNVMMRMMMIINGGFSAPYTIYHIISYLLLQREYELPAS